MPATIQGYRPDPRIRQRALAELRRLYGEVVRRQQGAIVFVAGEPGSGRRATLDALREALREDRSHPTVIAGTLAGGAYAPVAMARTDYDQAMDVLGNLLAVPALFVDPVFGPIVGLVAQLLQLGAVSRPFLQHVAGSHAQSPDLSTLALKRSLREAAGQHPVVCLLEHIDAAEARFLNSLFLTSAGELTDNRPLLIVASLDGPAELGAPDTDEPDALKVARSLVGRGLAQWLPLVPMTPAEIAAWLEDVEPRLVTHLARVTAGNPTWLALLWDDLWTREKVQRDPVSDRWRLQRGHELATIGTVHDIVGERLQVLLGSDEPAELEDSLYLLAVAALEGSTFTVAALARTLGHDEEEVAEFLDEVLVRSAEQPYGILEEAGHVTIPGIDEERWLWRYSFVSDLFWYTLTRYPSFTPERRAELCRALAGSLEQVYASEVRQIAHTLVRLFAEGGDAGRAEHYRTMAANVGTAAGWYAEAQLLMAVSRDGWEPADYTRAAVTLNKAARETYHVYPYHETLVIAENAYTVAQAASSRHEEAKALNNIGLVHSAMGEQQQALAYYEQTLPLWRQVGDRAGEATTLSNIGAVYSALGEQQRALAYFEQALPFSHQVGDHVGEATTLINVGAVYAALGEQQQALTYYEQALPLLRQVGDRAGQAAILNNIGGVRDVMGEKQQALAYYEQALSLSHQMSDRAGEARTLTNIGGVYAALGEKQQALAYYEQALPLWRQVGDRSGEATTLNNISGVYADLGEKQQALAYYEQAFSISRQVGDRAGEAATLVGIGAVYSALGEKQQALAYYEQALPLFRQVGDRAGEAATLVGIGAVYSALGEKQQALAYYEQALPLFRQVGNRAGEAQTLNNMAFIYFQQGQAERTVDLLRQAIQLDEEVKNVAQEAGHRFNLAVVLHQAFAQAQEAIALITESIAILEHYQLPLDANGATLANHQAFLAQLQGNTQTPP